MFRVLYNDVGTVSGPRLREGGTLILSGCTTAWTPRSGLINLQMAHICCLTAEKAKSPPTDVTFAAQQRFRTTP
jgi:hypothetical protein